LPKTAGSETVRTLRTKLGLVAGRATVTGKPIVYVYDRTTYRHEVENAAAGFLALNTPEMIKGPQDFQQAACRIGYTFNWVYADAQHIAYFNSGDDPVRAKGIDPRFPVDAKYEWMDYDPAENRMALAPLAPQAIDQRFFTSWNNKQAPGFRASDGNYAYGPVDRMQLLRKRIGAGIAGPKKMTLVQLVEAMEDGGTVDLRGQEVLPYVLAVLRRRHDASLEAPIALLTGWVASGAHRRDRDRNGGYDDADAVALMDAWWPRLLEVEFKPALGDEAFKALRSSQQFHDDPHGHLGSAFDDGWYGFTNKDLRMLLNRDKVRGRWSRTYRGRTLKRSGTLKRCAAALGASLKDAVAVAADRTKLYSGSDCKAGDQICWDEVRFRALGGITQPPINWINRPTFQQANEVQHAVPREPGSPFAYPPR
jgi:Penicillin amidase